MGCHEVLLGLLGLAAVGQGHVELLGVGRLALWKSVLLRVRRGKKVRSIAVIKDRSVGGPRYSCRLMDGENPDTLYYDGASLENSAWG